MNVLFPSTAPRLDSPELNAYPRVSDIGLDNPKRELRVATFEIKDRTSAAVGFLKLITDKTKEAQILQSKYEFVRLVSHQLRTPLTAVGWTFQLLRKEPLTEDQNGLVRTGSLATDELQSRIDDIIEVTKIEDGRFDYKFCQCAWGRQLPMLSVASGF